ncbi:MAG: hypothetical protein QHJ82_17390, partial [Verrucomicrobiota bacterium]|nr:hypothetical protein [Verrucomicrobiota bacterium]
ERISFKGMVDAISQYTQAIAQARSQKKQRELVADLLRVRSRCFLQRVVGARAFLPANSRSMFGRGIRRSEPCRRRISEAEPG